jgi:chaperonin cofactor prefoldin
MSESMSDDEKGKVLEGATAPKEGKAKALKIKICFDTTQSERGKLDENYTKFKEIAEKLGYSIVSNIEFPITFRQLSHYEIVFFACPDRSKIREFEIQEILKYVRNGGAIVVMASSGGDKGRMTNLNDLCTKFGIEFNNDQVFDDQHNYGIRNLAISTAFEDHPLTKGLELVIIPSSCSLSVSSKAKGVILTDSDAEPPNVPVIAVSEYGFGRVIVVGSYDTFRDSIRAGIQVIQHRILLENILNWAVQDKPLSQILFAFSLLRLKEKKEVKTAPSIISSSLPSTQGMVSPEAILDQILSNLQQVKQVGNQLENVQVALNQVALEVKKLNQNLENTSEIKANLKKIQTDTTITNLNQKIETLDNRFSDMSEKMEKIFTILSQILEKSS